MFFFCNFFCVIFTFSPPPCHLLKTTCQCLNSCKLIHWERLFILNFTFFVYVYDDFQLLLLFGRFLDCVSCIWLALKIIHCYYNNNFFLNVGLKSFALEFKWNLPFDMNEKMRRENDVIIICRSSHFHHLYTK